MKHWVVICSIFALLFPAVALHAADPPLPPQLKPTYRTSILVSDLERSLTLYRDVLGLTVSRVSQTAPDSYSYRFFNIKPGAMKRFAYLNGEAGNVEVLGIGEVPGIQLGLPESPRAVAYVQTVRDVEGVKQAVERMGLRTIEPVRFESREAGRPGIEFGIIDFDGHLILVYGLLRENS